MGLGSITAFGQKITQISVFVKYLENCCIFVFSYSFWDIWISVQKLPLYSGAKLFSLYFQVSFSSFMWALKKLLKSPMIYKLQSNNNDLMSEKKEGLKIFAWGAEFWKSLFWTVHRPCPCSLWCGMSWNSHHHTWLYHHQGCSITTTRVWNDTSKIDICHPQMGAIMGLDSRFGEAEPCEGH